MERGRKKDLREYVCARARARACVRGFYKKRKNTASLTGFEPVREDPNGFLVHRLNHSATTTTGVREEFIIIIIIIIHPLSARVKGHH